jgi:hypothetical protein
VYYNQQATKTSSRNNCYLKPRSKYKMSNVKSINSERHVKPFNYEPLVKATKLLAKLSDPSQRLNHKLTTRVLPHRQPATSIDAIDKEIADSQRSFEEEMVSIARWHQAQREPVLKTLADIDERQKTMIADYTTKWGTRLGELYIEKNALKKISESKPSVKKISRRSSDEVPPVNICDFKNSHCPPRRENYCEDYGASNYLENERFMMGDWFDHSSPSKYLNNLVLDSKSFSPLDYLDTYNAKPIKRSNENTLDDFEEDLHYVPLTRITRENYAEDYGAVNLPPLQPDDMELFGPKYNSFRMEFDPTLYPQFTFIKDEEQPPYELEEGEEREDEEQPPYELEEGEEREDEEQDNVANVVSESETEDNEYDPDAMTICG